MNWVDMNRIREIAKKINLNNYDYDKIGIRVVAPGYDDYDAQIGDILPESHLWDDGEYTDITLDGTSALALPLTIGKSNTGSYRGDKILIVGGDHAEYGDDDGEIIIMDAVVLDIINLIS